jgi:hypothetical protein
MVLVTQKEYEKIKIKVKQIEDYIRKDILPHIYGTYEISFGSEKEKSGKSHLNLYVKNHGEGISGYSGCLYISFDAKYEPEECGRGVSVYNSWNYGGDFGYELISWWPTVKAKLLELKSKKEKELSERKYVLDNFEV